MDQPLATKSREPTFLSASISSNKDKPNGLAEKTVFRSQKFPELKEHQFENKNLNTTASNMDACSRCSSIFPATPMPKSTQSARRASAENSGTNGVIGHVCAKCRQHISLENEERIMSPKRRNGKKKTARDSLDWDNLGEKIEDWFEVAKTPEQKVVYRFLSNIKDEEYDNERNNSALSAADSNITDKAQSLEDILDNLKKYRNKFNRKGNNRAQTSGLPKIAARNQNNTDLLSMSNENLKNSFESSTWRVMRHLRSADIRNKYPLPKANPDYHFRNATIFQTAGRAPKSTFLLHPDWV